MKAIRLALLTAISTLLFGCQAPNGFVDPGEFGRLYAPAGVFVELFVDPDDPGKLLFTIGSESAEDEYIMLNFDGKNAERISLMKGSEGVMINFEKGLLDLNSASVFVLRLKDGARIHENYRLVPSESDSNKPLTP